MRAEALASALSAAAALGDADVAWAADAADSLERMAAHGGVAADPRALASLRDGAAGLASLPAAERPGAARALAAALDGLRGAVAAADGGGPLAPLPLGTILAAATEDAARAARARGVTVAVDVSGPEGVRVPLAVAGALLDALGRIVRDSVVFGTPSGGGIRIVAHTERDDLIVVVGDRTGSVGPGGPAPRGPALAGARLAGLHAAGGCLATAGGELSAGAGPWGGASMTVRVPLAGTGLRRA
jgi:hypothetical protein